MLVRRPEQIAVGVGMMMWPPNNLGDLRGLAWTPLPPVWAAVMGPLPLVANLQYLACWMGRTKADLRCGRLSEATHCAR